MPIPEFILKKLIVPGSFHQTQQGFRFNILNTFGPVTILTFNLRLGNTLIPNESITIAIPGMPDFNGASITPENFMLLPVKKEISVFSSLPSSGLPIYIKAMTREVGEIEFCINPDKATSKPRELKHSIFANFSRVEEARVDVFPEQPVGQASPFILGQFVEHLERCVYDGIWTVDGKQLRQDTLDLITQLHPPLIRYPGGNFASGYHWEDGIGAREARPVRHDAAWQAEESNQVGTDEFLSFCEKIGAEAVICVNDGSGTAEEAARWVAYCNDSEDTEQGARRAANGHPKPYNVKYWGIGNEVWGPWQIGTTTPLEYAQRAAKFIQAMKQVDPSIKIVGVGNNPLTDDPEDEATLWNQVVLERLKSDIDYLSWHIYQPDKSNWQESYDPLELFQAVCAAPLDIEEIIKRVESQIHAHADEKNILQAVDEWNLWLPPREKNVSMHRVTYTMRDALYATSVLMIFLKYGRTVGMANLAQLVNVLPLIETSSTSAIPTAMFFPFILAGQMQRNIIHTSVESETYNSKAISINIQAHENIPYLDALASLSDDRQIMTLLLVNRYPANRLTVEINPGSAYHRAKNALKLSAKSPGAFNSFEHPDSIKISDGALPKLDKGKLVVTLAPASVYFVEFEK